MTHDELLANLNDAIANAKTDPIFMQGLRAVVELHKPEHSHSGYRCTVCFIDTTYPCETIEAIEKELG